MNDVDISVVVATYNSNIKRIKETLYSIMLQEDVKYEIIMVDDGSVDDYRDEIIEFFERYSFSDYCMVLSKENRGTVKNMLSSFKYCNGKYIKGISPGDFFYDSYTLRDWLKYLKKEDCAFCFARYATYSLNSDSMNDTMETVNLGNRPYDLSVYIPKVNTNLIKYKYLLLDDYCVGAAVIAKTDVFKDYLSKLDGKVKYAEDAVFRHMISDNLFPGFFDRLTIWYSYGDGISTNGKYKWWKIIYKDHYKAGLVIRDSLRNRKDWFNKRYSAVLFLSKYAVIRIMTKYILFPSLIIQRLRKPNNMGGKIIDNSFLSKILQLEG